MQLNGVECRTETAANKLYDIAALLRSAEQRYPMSADEWRKLSHVVRHALDDVMESSLCGECIYGDSFPPGPSNKQIAEIYPAAGKAKR